MVFYYLLVVKINFHKYAYFFLNILFYGCINILFLELDIMEKKSMDFTVLIEQGEDSMYVGIVPDIEGCYTQGKTIPEVLERIKEAIEVCIESGDKEIVPLQFVGVQKVSVSV